MAASPTWRVSRPAPLPASWTGWNGADTFAAGRIIFESLAREMSAIESQYSQKELATAAKFMTETTEILRRETAKLTQAKTPPVLEHF